MIDGIPEEMHPQRVAPRVEAIREFHKKTRAEFADSLGIDRSSWTKIEKGLKPLRDDRAFMICELYGATMDFIYRGWLHELPDPMKSFVRDWLAKKRL